MPGEYQDTAADRLARLRGHCRASRAELPPKTKPLLTRRPVEAARHVRAGAPDPDLFLSVVLAVSPSWACARQVEGLRPEVGRLEEHLKSPGGRR